MSGLARYESLILPFTQAPSLSDQNLLPTRFVTVMMSCILVTSRSKNLLPDSYSHPIKINPILRITLPWNMTPPPSTPSTPQKPANKLGSVSRPQPNDYVHIKRVLKQKHAKWESFNEGNNSRKWVKWAIPHSFLVYLAQPTYVSRLHFSKETST